jgi:hypothetical protein
MCTIMHTDPEFTSSRTPSSRTPEFTDPEFTPNTSFISGPYVPDVAADNEIYFTSANSGTLDKKCSILSRARVHAVHQTCDSSRRRRTRPSSWRCR